MKVPVAEDGCEQGVKYSGHNFHTQKCLGTLNVQKVNFLEYPLFSLKTKDGNYVTQKTLYYYHN